MDELENLRAEIGRKQAEHKALLHKSMHDKTDEVQHDLERVEKELDGLVEKYQAMKSEIYGHELQLP